ncbi:glutamine-synthetase adenylyltransferase [Erythrobacter sp. YT30]|nr:bifunctional [glutamate--ammonia ligase]-adenylyl-L-tyrosine phosphorylase/[glutamate--ammonia-ligase] adenylyltransferase [Erythrobacter sp. YT30]KWV91520.1 glutamine-synthetase adenylyltransferase [Erythrobacter sp. YT30]
MDEAEKGDLAEDWGGALERAKVHSPFLCRALERQPDLEALLAAGDGEAALEWARAQGEHDDTAIALRRERLGIATAIAIGDLAGAFPLSRVVAELTDFADRAVDRAIRAVINERMGEADPSGFIALALGKQGAGELNYSSDIDPIWLYDPATLAHRGRDDAGEAAQRYARKIVAMLSDTTDEGYVLRVDLRLRPASETSPLVVRRGVALTHYQSQALAWERAALTKARAASGDIAAGERFLDEISPFVWQHRLDFGAVDAINALTQRIRDNQKGAQKPGPGFDVKKGRGGIREIEFYAQTHQLIHGGRDPSLRVRGTRAALDALVAAGQIDPSTATTLGESYDRLRVIEHRLQMVHDRQTHSLPEGHALDNVARLDGLADGAELIADLEAVTGRVRAIYDSLVESKSAPAAPPVEAQSELSEMLAEIGFDEAASLARRIEGWHDGRYACLRTDQAREAFERVLPRLLTAFSKSDDPMRAMARWEAILEHATSAIHLFRLLDARPALLERLVAALTLAPRLADELARRPELLDTLLDRSARELPGTPEEIAARIEEAAVRPDFEALLDAIRLVTGEIRFALGLRMIEGEADPLMVGAALSRAAEAAIHLAVRDVSREFAAKHGVIAESELLLLGLGRFGGGALTHSSDLDVVFLFTGSFSDQSDGDRPLGATHYYNRLASRIISALSVPTAQGALYEVDTRLRPQGAQGPLAVSTEAFAKYQEETAWTWEHMALARARVLVGSDTARAELEATMRGVLARQRDAHELADAVTSMRREMAKHKQATGPLDAKLSRGGLVDCEFLVHFLQLRGTDASGAPLYETHPNAYSPDLADAIPALIAAGHLPTHFLPDYDLMSRMLVAGRLLAPGNEQPPPYAAAALAAACQQPTYNDLLQAFGEARQRVIGVWSTILGEAISDTDTEPNDE